MARPLIFIVAKLGLVNSAHRLSRELNLEMPSLVKMEIEGALREFGTTVGGPYSGMKNRPQ